MRKGNFELVDKAIFNWFQSMRSQNIPLSAAMIQEKALTFVKELNAEKKRNLITFNTVSGESKSVTPEMIDAWSETPFIKLIA